VIIITKLEINKPFIKELKIKKNKTKIKTSKIKRVNQ
jgi:hypothetical protein